MKVKLFFHILFFLSVLCGLNSCRVDGSDPVPSGPGNYTEGVFVVNEGPFGGTGTITWHNPNTGETVQDVFGQANGGAVLGEFVQSLTIYNGRGFIVVNGANKIYVVNATSFKFLYTINGLELPRYFLPKRDFSSTEPARYAYVSQWGANGLDGSVAKVDLITNQVVAHIPLGHGPEKLYQVDNSKLLAPNSGGFGVDSTVSVIDMDHDKETERLLLAGRRNPCCLAAGTQAAGQPFVLCKGDYLDPASLGWFGIVTAPTAATGSDVPPGADDLCQAPGAGTLYFTASGAIYKSTASGIEKFFDQQAYGLGCDPRTGNLYCADAKDFNSSGEVVIYSPSGTKINSFATGIAPGELVFIQ